MMLLTRRAAMCASLAAVLLLGSAAPVGAQAGPIAHGHGSFVANNQELHTITFNVVGLPDGSVRGHAVIREPSTQAFVIMEVSSLMFLGETLAVAGEVTKNVNAPAQHAVGSTAFFSVNDYGNDPTMPDDFAGLGSVPPFLGNLTIQEIIALIGPPPPQAFTPFLTGGVQVH